MADAQRREDDRSYGRDRRDYRDDDRRRRSSRERYARSRSPRDSRRGDDDYRRHDRERPRSRDERRYERRARSRDDDRRYEQSSRGDDRRYERSSRDGGAGGSSRGDDRRYERRRSRGREASDRRYARRSRSRGDERRYTRRSRSRGDERDDYYPRPRSRDGYRDRTDPRAQPTAPAPARPKSEIESTSRASAWTTWRCRPLSPRWTTSWQRTSSRSLLYCRSSRRTLSRTSRHGHTQACIDQKSFGVARGLHEEGAAVCNVYSMTGFVSTATGAASPRRAAVSLVT